MTSIIISGINLTFTVLRTKSSTIYLYNCNLYLNLGILKRLT